MIVYDIHKEEEILNKKIVGIIKSKLEMNFSEENFKDIYRIGRNKTNEIRPVVCEVLNHALKQNILKQSLVNKEKFKQSKIYFNHDYILNYEKRKLSLSSCNLQENITHKHL